MFLHEFLITSKPTLQGPSINYSRDKFIIKEVCSRNKSKFTKKVNIPFYMFYTFRKVDIYVKIWFNHEEYENLDSAIKDQVAFVS